MKQIQDTPYYVTPCGAVISLKGRSIRHMKPGRAGAGYPAIIMRVDGHNVGAYVHRLVAEAFIAPVEGMTVDHGNFDKTDNCVWNLEVVLHADNMKRAFDAGRIPVPPRNPRDPVTGRFC